MSIQLPDSRIMRGKPEMHGATQGLAGIRRTNTSFRLMNPGVHGGL
jgi:hypothetical protein